MIGTRPRFLPGKGTVEGLGGLEFLATSLGVPLGVVSTVKAGSAVSQQMRYGLAYALTSARLRPLGCEPFTRMAPSIHGSTA